MSANSYVGKHLKKRSVLHVGQVPIDTEVVDKIGGKAESGQGYPNSPG
jgi:hypothetical protein